MNGKIKEQMQSRILSNLLCFFTEQELQQEDIKVTNYDTSLFPGM